MSGGRRFARVVVAEDEQDAAFGRYALQVGVLDRIARAVDPRPLAIPHAEHAIDLAPGHEVDLLGTAERGEREILVEAGLKVT